MIVPQLSARLSVLEANLTGSSRCVCGARTSRPARHTVHLFAAALARGRRAWQARQPARDLVRPIPLAAIDLDDFL